MSRAFVKEDDGDVKRHIDFGLPSRQDKSYASASALVLIEAARDGFLAEAEDATGYKWGDPYLRPHVQKVLDKELERPEDEQDRRFIQMARRFIRYR